MESFIFHPGSWTDHYLCCLLLNSTVERCFKRQFVCVCCVFFLSGGEDEHSFYGSMFCSWQGLGICEHVGVVLAGSFRKQHHP